MSLSDFHTVEGAFQAYMDTMFKGVLIGPAQHNELKKAFFGAVLWLLELQRTVIADIENEDEAVAALEKLRAETILFGHRLPDNGKGGPTNEPLIIVPPHH